SSGDTAVGVTLAFNTVGWEAQNILFQAIDALIGTNIGNENPAKVEAYIENTSLDVGGDLTVSADNSAQLNATVSNAASSAASALYGASGAAASAVLTSNMVSSSATAYISYGTSGTATVGGHLSVTAKDEAGVYSNVKLVSSSVTTNDGGMSVLTNSVRGAEGIAQTDFYSSDGSQPVEFGDIVKLAGDYGGEDKDKGTPGSLYKYLGTAKNIDLSNTDYSNKDDWKEISATQYFPQGLNVSDSDSMAIGGLIVRNDLRSDVDAHITNATVSAGSVTVSADENATVKAIADSTAKSSGGSAFGDGQSLAVNGIIATNLVISNAEALISSSSITTTTGDLKVEADNNSIIDATNKSVTESGDTAVGVTLAFNTVGWEAQNILFAAIDALVGTDIGNEDPASVKASIVDSSLTVAGNISVTAQGRAKIKAELSNDSTSAASALFGASGMAVSAVLASNMVSSTADAYIDYTSSQGSVVSSGSITVSADDSAVIDATDTMKAISSTTNDAGASMLGGLVDSAASGYDYSSHSGSQSLTSGDLVRVASDHSAGGVLGATYKYTGSDAATNLGTTDYNGSGWTRVNLDNLSSVIPNIGNITDSDSVGVGGQIVRNDVRSNVISYIDNANIQTSGDLTVSSVEKAQIQARIESVVSSSGGSAFGEGTSLAINGTIATNLVLGSAKAYITQSAIDIDGSVNVSAQNTSGMDATVKSSTSSGDTAVGVTLAFNTVGWEAQNILFQAIDALIGTNIGNENPAKVEAY
ncbi:MAG: hypothetical protein HN929_09860, partial [Chloroflexi bacterium]|nr:hypothetical protein [Chloroflexota bacterium]